MKRVIKFKSLLFLAGIWLVANNIIADHYCTCTYQKYDSYHLLFVQTDNETGEILKKHTLKTFAPRDGFDEGFFEKSVSKRCERALKKHPSCS